MTSTPSKTADWRTLYPFASHWADLPGGRMHYLDDGPAGRSDALLFIHGNPTWSFHWRRLILALRGEHRCIAPDHLGCGLSEKPAHLLQLNDHITNLCTLVERLGLELRFGVSEVAPAHCRDAVCSSSRIRDLVRSGDLRSVHALLGAPWTVDTAI